MKLRLFTVGKVNTALLPCDGHGLIGSDERKRSFVPGLVPLGKVQ